MSVTFFARQHTATLTPNSIATLSTFFFAHTKFQMRTRFNVLVQPFIRFASPFRYIFIKIVYIEIGRAHAFTLDNLHRTRISHTKIHRVEIQASIEKNIHSQQTVEIPYRKIYKQSGVNDF